MKERVGIFADSSDKARIYADLIGTDNDDVYSAGIGTALAGRCFDKVFVIRSLISDTSEPQETTVNEWFKHLQLKMSPGNQRRFYVLKELSPP